MPDVRTQQADVVIVGSGGAGVAAAIEVAERGGNAIVLEREAELGGAAAISGGGCCLVGTPLQKDKGIQDSPDLAFQDWVTFGGGAADEPWARFYIYCSFHDLYEWGQAHRVRWMDVTQNEGNSVPRWHRPQHAGPGIWKALHESALDKGARTWLANVAATEILMDGGKAIGVRARRTDSGEEVEYRGRAVVLASGGFASNLDMLYEHCPQFRPHRLLEGSHVGARGEGHGMAVKVGGILTHMDELWLYVFSIPDHKDPNGRRGLVIRGTPSAVWVNREGRRFHNETLSGGATGAPAVVSQPGAECWAIIDSTMVEGVTVTDPYYYQPGSNAPNRERVRALLKESPHVVRADTLPDLAAKTGVPAAALAETLDRYNGCFQEGLEQDADFHKELKGLKPVVAPPYYAFHFFPLARKNFGGVKTDLRCRVLDKWYEPVPGLYAAGELTGMAGGHINGKAGLEGTMLGPSIFSGRVAGAWAAHEAGFGDGFKGSPNRE